MITGGWVKLYRVLLQNELLVDRVSLQIFVYCLLKCNDEGKVRVSRYRTSQILELHPETFRKGLERLKQHQRITTPSTNKYTIVSISNSTIYQQASTIKKTNTVPTEYHYNKNRTEKREDFFKVQKPEGHIPYEPPRD